MFIWIAIVAYLLFAINAVIDKFLLHKRRIGHPATYAFAIGMLSLIVVVLVPFGFNVPDFNEIILSLVAGGLFTFALLAFFAGLKQGEASRVVPVVGGFVPFWTLILAFFLIGERLERGDLVAFGFLVAGTMLIGVMGEKGVKGEMGVKGEKGEMGVRGWLPLLAAFLFAASFTLTKAVFENLGFINGFVWTRFGMAAGALIILFDTGSRRAILSQPKRTSRHIGVLFLLGQGIGALGGFAQNYAIALGSVTIVNALQGTQFVFLLALTSFLSIWHPRILWERMNRDVLVRKIIAVGLISVGVVMLAL